MNKLIAWINPEEVRKVPAILKRWDPFLSDFLHIASDNVSRTNKFYCDQVGFEQDMGGHAGFVRFFNERERMDPKDSAFVLLGRVGVGKTSFLEWWKEQRLNFCSIVDINHEGISVPEGNAETTNKHLHRIFASDMIKKHRRNTEFNTELSKKIAIIRSVAGGKDYEDFETGFINQSHGFMASFPEFGWNVLLASIIATIKNVYNKPVWLIIDNVDLEKPNVQENFIRASYSIHQDIKELAGNNAWDVSFHVVMSARPETWQHWSFYRANFQDIEYPTPDVVEIARKKISYGLDVAASKVQFPMPITIRGHTFNRSMELAEHIKTKIFTSIKDQSWPFDIDASKWHFDLVNGNVRRFVKAWAHIMISGNFIDFWVFPDSDEEERYVSPYRYVRMLIKGQYNFFPGNLKIGFSGENPNAPLFFNVFGFPYNRMITDQDAIDHYFIYMRILQYLLATETEVSYTTLLKDLSPFFAEHIIDDSVKILLWTRLIDEITLGARNIGAHGTWDRIYLDDRAQFHSNETSSLYLHHLLAEYEYVSAMAIVSLQFESSEDVKDRNALTYDSVILNFLKSNKEILINNLNNYEKKGLIPNFKRLFVTRFPAKRPWAASVSCVKKVFRERARFNPEYTEMLNAIEILEKEGRAQFERILK